MRLLLLTPPMTQLNTPYPATAYLTGFLRQHAERLDLQVVQADPAIELFLRIFCRSGIARIADELTARAAQDADDDMPASIEHFLKHKDAFINTVDGVVRFLQGRDPALALRIAGREHLPEGPRFAAINEGPDPENADPLGWAFGGLGHSDRAKYLASLYIDDLADAIRDGIDPRFTLSRYGESLASSAPSFDPIAEALAAPPTMIDTWLDAITVELLTKHQPDVVGLTAPFPGNVYGAFRIAQATKAFAPNTRVVLGGGYVNTELRSLTEPRVFDFVDFITLDDGEQPMLALLEHLGASNDPSKTLFRTFVRDQHGVVMLRSDPTHHDIPHRDTGTPTYDGLPLDRYLSLFEMLNPMHRLWSDGRWNKLTVAHGCYWKKCSFCDVTLDYIGRYDPASADILVDRIEAMIAETGQTGFHLVDEAAPPSALRALAHRLIERNVEITWWGNVRFEKAFTPELARLLARAGCVAISGGLEVASDRLLTLMNKGVTVAQVARVTRAFTDAGIMVHAYLMYGFPTETVQDTVDALEMVRQLFVAGCIQSAFWHRFAATAHSPIGKQPELFGIRLQQEPTVTFARNEVAFDDPTAVDHDELGEGLRRALYNYMHGVGLQENVTSWFRGKRGGAKRMRVPISQVATNMIACALDSATVE